MVAAALLLGAPGAGWAQSILQGLTGSEEISYSLFTSKTRDLTGTTTTIETLSYGSRTTLLLNYNLLPTLNLNAGGTYDRNLSEISGDIPDAEIDFSRLRPYLLLTLRDPIIGGSFGYDLFDERSRVSGQQAQERTRETYTANLLWRPVDLPATQARYTRSSTWDGTRTVLDAEQDLFYAKSEYLFRGLHVYYSWNRVDTHDNILDVGATQTTHEARALYTTALLENRVIVTTDNRVRHNEIISEKGFALSSVLGTAAAIPQPAVGGLFSLDNTPVDGPPLGANPALIDGDVTTSAGINIGFPGVGGDFTMRNIGLDFGTAVSVNTLSVWVGGFVGPLPADITSWYTWNVYVSSDNVTWALHAIVPAAAFGPLDARFTITFPVVATRYVKLVVAPLPGGPIGSTNSSLFTTIFVTELQAFVDRTAGAAASGAEQRFTQTTRSHNLDVRVLVLRLPILYYLFNASYQIFDPEHEDRHTISNGLSLTHRINPILSTSANITHEFGSDRGEPWTATQYNASLTATPLRTLTDSLIFSGRRQTARDVTSFSNSFAVYNTAQLYRGLDLTANFGAVFTSEEQATTTTRRRELYMNLGTGITPHPALTLTTYYLGKLSHVSVEGGPPAGTTGPAERIENRVDVNASFSPFSALSLTASANILTETGRKPMITQTYGANWAPFPDGQLQFSLFYAQSYLSENVSSRMVQPGIRWYFNARRRSYVEGAYQINSTDSPTQETNSTLFSARLNLAF